MNSTDLIIYIFLILLLIFIFNKISNNTDDILSDNLENYSNHYDITRNKKQVPPQAQQHDKYHVSPPVKQHTTHPTHPKIHHNKNNKNNKIGKFHEYDNSHNIDENNFKLGSSSQIMEILKPDNTDFYLDEGEDLSELITNTNKLEKKTNIIETFNIDSPNKTKNCLIEENVSDADTYIRKRLLDGSNYRSPKNYSNDELKKYRDTHFAFRNNIWQTSNNVDMVDKINDMYYSGDYDLTRNRKGTRIADLFDDLTKNENKITQPCISNITSDKGIERILDQQTKKIEGHNGNMLSNESWVYNQEKTINGGNFYDNIKPNEDNNSLYQAL